MRNWTLLLLLALPGTLYGQGSQYFFPQVADGISGSAAYVTSFSLTNPQDSTANVTMQFFRPNALQLTLGLISSERQDLTGPAQSLSFSMSPGETFFLRTRGAGPLVTGWAQVQSSLPIEVLENFSVTGPNGDGPVGSEAGVPASPLSTEWSFPVSRSNDEPIQGTNIDFGIAIANPSGATAQITAKLASKTGSVVSQKQFFLTSGEQTALFISELFKGFVFEPVTEQFHGSMQLSSNVNVAVVALRQAFGDSDTISSVSVSPDSVFARNSLYDVEPNDTTGFAERVGSLPAEIFGTINSPSDGPDTDIYSVQLRAGTVLFVFVASNLIGSELDPMVRILDPNGAILSVAPPLSAGLKDQFIRFQTPANGTFLISVTSASGASGRSLFYRLHVVSK